MIKMQSKYFIKRAAGRFLSHYKSSQRELRSLERDVPSFLRKSFLPEGKKARALVLSMGSYGAKIEAVYLKALEAMGYEPWVLAAYDPFLADIFGLFGVKNIIFYDDYFHRVPAGSLRVRMDDASSRDGAEWLGLEYAGIAYGKYAISRALRSTRANDLNEAKAVSIKKVQAALLSSCLATDAAGPILDHVRPGLLVVNDRGYAPEGILFDACLARGVPVLQRCSAHKSGHEILKRYASKAMAEIHPHSLSVDSWQKTLSMPWKEEMWSQVKDELRRTYLTGDWFSEAGTQFNKQPYTKDQLIARLGLDPCKKIACVFPHIFWDATFFWGTDLFPTYAEWFRHVLKVAVKNDKLNWILKAHPANVVKAQRDGYQGEHNELKMIKETIGELPGHIKVIPPESDINTFSLFDLIDHCLTVRGTIGVEASAMGITTLTAGTGRYDGLGFTVDSASPEEYLERIRHLQDVPPMTPHQIELARRFAYGIFQLRPIHFDLLETKHVQDRKASIAFKVLAGSRDEFMASHFFCQFRDFMVSGDEDFLNEKFTGKI